MQHSRETEFNWFVQWSGMKGCFTLRLCIINNESIVGGWVSTILQLIILKRRVNFKQQYSNFGPTFLQLEFAYVLFFPRVNCFIGSAY